MNFNVFKLYTGVAVVDVTASFWAKAWRVESVAQYNSALQHIITEASSGLSLDNVRRNPECYVFLSQLSAHSIKFEHSNSFSQDQELEKQENERNKKNVKASFDSAVQLAKLLIMVTVYHDCVRSIMNFSCSTSSTSTVHSQPRNSGFAEESPPVDSEMQTDFPDGDRSTAGLRRWTSLLQAQLDFVLMYRTALAIVMCCECVQSELHLSADQIKSNHIDRARVDHEICGLITSSLGKHCAAIRASQCLTVSALSAQFIEQISPSGLTVTDYEVVKSALSVIDLAYSPRTPGNKIATIGFSRFIKFSTLLNPLVCICIL